MQENESAEVLPTQGSIRKRSKKSRLQRRLLVIGLTSVVLVGLVVAGLLTKRFAVALTPNTHAAVVTTVCTPEDITKFNTLIQKDYTAFQTHMKDITNRSRYTDDASCVFMAYRYFLEELQYSKAVEMADRYKQLIAAGVYSSGAINYDQSLAQLESTVSVIRSFSDGQSMSGNDEDDN